MGRPHSLEHRQAVIDDWRRLLLAVPWRWGAGAPQLLAIAMDIDAAGMDTVQIKRLREAAASLQQAIIAVTDKADRPDSLDAWIEQHLLTAGPRLLISEAHRQTVLARARDSRRRRVHAERGLHSARIEMSDKSWTKLWIIRDELARTYSNVTLGWALERVIAAYGMHQSTVPLKKEKGPNPAERTRPDDLFSVLDLEPR